MSKGGALSHALGFPRRFPHISPAGSPVEMPFQIRILKVPQSPKHFAKFPQSAFNVRLFFI